jgi:hypothetical protein
LQQNCSPLQGVQTVHWKKIHHWQMFHHSAFWICIGVHALDLYFRLEKTDTAVL